LLDLFDQYLIRYSNSLTRRQNRKWLEHLFRNTGKRHPEEITTEELFMWTTSATANNSVRNRLSTVRSFYRWCVRTGVVVSDPTTELDSLTKQYPRTYGKVQAQNPARRLSRTEAFDILLAPTQDGTSTGLRDEIGLRLALTGMRAAEVVGLTWSDLNLTTSPIEIRWIGKGRKARHIVPGTVLLEALERWRTLYSEGLGHVPTPADPIVCRQISAAGRATGPKRIEWGHAMAVSTYFQLVQRCGRAAGLGDIAPHDLRRTAAGILHHATTDDGSHHFDLLDIQKVLGHSDPATTMRSYLDPMDTGVQVRAADFLD